MEKNQSGLPGELLGNIRGPESALTRVCVSVCVILGAHFFVSILVMLTSILLSEIVTGGWGVYHLSTNIRKTQGGGIQNTGQQTLLIRQLASFS